MKTVTGKNLLFFFVFFYLVQLTAGCLLIYFFYTLQTKSYLNSILARVQSDISYHKGVWDMSAYDSDPQVPGRFRLYVFSLDGFVVDRWRPIPGFLDDSDFKHLLTYHSPETVHTITNQDWRIYSKPVMDTFGNIIGVINTASYKPDLTDQPEMDEIDTRLKATADALEKKIVVKNQTISVNKMDLRHIAFDTPFQIVDQFNTVLIKNSNVNTMDRLPSFIDPSYIRSVLQTNSVQEIANQNQTDTFLLASRPLFDSNHNIFGVVVAATTIGIMYSLLKIYLMVESILGILLTVIFWVLVRRISKHAEKVVKTHHASAVGKPVMLITFSKKACTMSFDKQTLAFAYASNQYYLCTSLFSAPKKKWEVDELLERFGEEHSREGWRKIYDAATSINKKTSGMLQERLITTNNKTFQINPHFVEKIRYLP